MQKDSLEAAEERIEDGFLVTPHFFKELSPMQKAIAKKKTEVLGQEEAEDGPLTLSGEWEGTSP